MGEDYYNSENPNKALGIVIPKHLGVFGFQLPTLHNMKGKKSRLVACWIQATYTSGCKKFLLLTLLTK